MLGQQCEVWLGSRIGRAMGLMHGPFEPGHIGQIRLGRQLFCRSDEGRQLGAPLRHVTTRRWLCRPQGPGQGCKRGLAQKLHEGGIGRRQGALGQRTGIGSVDLQAPGAALGCIAQPARHHAGPRIAPQRTQQHLLAQPFFVESLFHYAASATTSASIRPWACRASSSSTSSSGRSVSHSISVGLGPRRRSAWA